MAHRPHSILRAYTNTFAQAVTMQNPLRSSSSQCWLLALLLLVAPFVSAKAESPSEYDVVIYGATPAGVCAAVAASREGATTCLVEPLELVGGIMSSGLSFSDSNQTARECLLGLFEEFHLRVEDDYRQRGITLPYRVDVKDQAKWTYEPHVAERVFLEMLREAGVQVLLGQSLQSLEKNGARITHLRTDRDQTLAARAFVDATYEGDLMAAAGVEYRVGREARSEYGESLAGHRYPKKPVAVSPRSEDGQLLPLMTGQDAGDPDRADGKIMSYSFRLCLTDDPERQIPITKPADYDPKQFELLRRYLSQFPDSPFPIDLYPIPGGKVDGNNGIGKQISLALVGASWEWPDATPARRKEIWQAHRSYTKGLLWFLANDPDVPKAIRDRAGRLGLAKDEFERFGHWPPVLYVREGRRMVGQYVLTQRDIRDDIEKPDAIAVGSFPIDSHDCQRIPTEDGNGFIDEGTIFPRHLSDRAIGQPHQIPYRAIVPKPEQCDNLLVPVCLSASHVALSSVRVEPTWITLGQSSGIAAALSAKANRPVQELEYSTLRERLAAQNMALSLPPIAHAKKGK